MEYVCDECGKPATCFSRDLIRYDGGLGYWEYQIAEARPVRLGCDDHQPCSDTTRLCWLESSTVEHNDKLYAKKAKRDGPSTS